MRIMGSMPTTIGPIVMNTEAELEQAYAELRKGTFVKQCDQ